MASRTLRHPVSTAPLGGSSPARRVGATLLLVALALIAALALVSRDSGRAPELPPVPAFLESALGPVQADGPFVAQPRKGVSVALEGGGYTVSRGATQVSLTRVGSGADGPWRRHEHGAVRALPFGSETVTVDGTTTEHFVTVRERQGPTTWRWQLEVDGGRARLAESGAVEIVRADGSVAPLAIRPVQILDADGHDATPRGLRWSLERNGAATWLTLDLDDERLPLPYVIDPATDYPSPLYLASTASLDTGSWKLVTVAPSTANATTITRAGTNATNTYYRWTPGVENTTGTTTPAVNAAGTGWLVDTAGGTGFPAGTWNFTVETDVPGTAYTAGTAILAVGVWKAQVSGGTLSNVTQIKAVTDDPAAQDLRPNLNVTTRTVGIAMPRFSLAANERLYVELWHKQVGGINSTNTTRRQLILRVNQGTTRIAPTPADDGAPSNALSLANASGAHLSGSTLYYKGNAAGSFQLLNTITDTAGTGTASGAYSSLYPVLSTAGWTHAAETVTTGPTFQSSAFSWTANPTNPSSYTVTAEDAAANAATTNGSISFTSDTTGPTVPTPTVTAGYYTSLSVPVALGSATDGGSGVDAGSVVVQRDEAPLDNGDGTCDSFPGSWSTVVLSGGNDTSVAPGMCYRYRQVVSDNVGNPTTSGISAIAKVETSAPGAPSLSVAESPADPDQHVSGTTVYYRPGQAGTFQVTGTASDVQSDVKHLAFPSLSGFTGGGNDAGSPYQGTYGWSAGTSGSPSGSVTATNNADLTSSGASFDVLADSAAPTGHSVSLTGGPWYAGTVDLTVTTGSDGGSGLDASSLVVERDEAPLVAGNCDPFPNTWGTTVSDPDASVGGGKCYRYRVRIADNVGNVSAWSSPSATAKVDTSAPGAPGLSLTESPADPDQHVTGGTVYYRPGQSGSFAVTATASDAESGIKHVSFPSIANVVGGADDASSPYAETYAWGASTAGTLSPAVTATNPADLIGSATAFALEPDSTAPASHSIGISGGPWHTTLSLDLVPAYGADGGSGVDSSSAVIERDEAPLVDGTCDPFPNTWGTTVSDPDTTVASGTCYRYRVRLADNVGNMSAPSSPSAPAQVDTSGPAAPGLTLTESPADPDQHVSGSTLFYRPGQAGGFKVAAAASDAQSGIKHVAFPNVAGLTGGATDASSPYEETYSWSGATTGSPSGAATATNNADLAGAGSSFGLEPDSTAPTTSDNTASLGPAWRDTDASVVLTPGDGAGAGVEETYYTTDGSAPTTSSPTGTSFTLSADGVHTVRYFSRDRVGNDETPQAGAAQVRIDKTDPTTATLDALPAVIRNGHVLSGAGSDPGGSGVDTVQYLYCSGAGCSPSTPIGSSAAGPSYSVTWNAQPADGTYRVLARVRDVAGNSSDSAVQSVVVDNGDPTGSLTAPADAAALRGTVSVASDSADAASSVATVLFERRPAGGGAWSTIGTDSDGAPFSVSWSTVAVADGDWELRAVTADAAGNSTISAHRTVTVDNTVPTGTLTDPGADLRGSVTLAASASDPGGSGVASVAFQRSDGAAWQTIATDSGGAPWTGSWDTTGASDGLHDLRALVTDAAGNQAASAVVSSRRVDNTAPTVSLNDPGANLRGSASLAASASDPAGSGVASVAFQRFDGTSWQTIATDSNGAPWTIDWDTTAASDGLHDLRAVATDVAGNATPSAPVGNRRVDNTDPSGVLTTPADGATLRGTVSVSTDSADSGSGVTSVLFERRPAGGSSWSTIGSDSDGAPFSISWDTTAAADGGFDLRATTTDAAGNSVTSGLRTIAVDNSDPSASLTAPAAGAALRGSVGVTAAASDAGGSGIATVTFERRPAGGGAWSSIGTDSDGAPYSAAWATGALADGDWELRAVATDVAGNAAGSATRTVTVDNTDPTGSLTAPADGSIVAGNISVSSSSADTGGAGVDAVVFERRPAGGGLWSEIGTDSDGAPYSVSWDTASVAEGSWELRSVTTDEAGNTSTSPTRTVTVDNAPPTVSIDDPGAHLRASIPLTASTSADTVSVVFERRPAGGGPWTAVGTDSDGAPWSVSWDTTAAADGLYDLRAVATDGAGNSTPSTAVTGRRVDNTDPSGALTAPADGAILRGTVAVSTGSADSGSGVATVLFERRPAGGGSWSAIGTDSDGAPYTVSFATGGVADGDWELRATTTDRAGNSLSSAARTITVDNTDPTGALTAPADGAAVRGTIGLSSSSTDTGGSGVDSVLFERRAAGGGSWTTIGTDSDGAPYATSFATGSVTDGDWELRATTTDRAGNGSVSALRTVTVDNADPTAALVDPGADLRGSVTLTASATDAGGSGVASVAFERFDGASWQTIATDSGGAPWSVSWATTGVDDGLHDLRAVATDSAGNQTVSAVVASRRVDNTDPAAVLTDPGANLRGSVSLAATASDAAGSGVASVAFQRFDGAAWQTIATDSDGAPWSVAWTTTGVVDGLYDLRAVATDVAGNAAASAPISNRRVDNTDPTGSLTAPADGSALRGTVALTTNSADSGSGVTSVLFERRPAGGGSWSTIGTDSDGAPYSIDWATAAGSEGEWDLRATTTDAAGNSVLSPTRTVEVDNADPSSSLTSPADGAAVRGTVTVSASSADSGSGVDTVVFERRPAGGGAWSTIGSDSDGAPYSVDWATAAGAEGEWELRATTTDRAGNTAVSPLRMVEVDNTDPTGSLSAPADGALVSGSIAVSTSSADSGSGVTSVHFERRPAGGSSWSAIGTDSDGAPWSIPWSTSAVADGNWELRAVTTDRAGNAFTSPLRTVSVDNDAPSVSLTDPGASLRGSVSLAASASGDTASVLFERRPAGGGAWTALGVDASSPFSVTWDTAALADGLYDLRAVATDGAGNSTPSIPIADRRVDNTDPTGSLTAPANGSALRGSITVSTGSADAGGSGVATVLFERRPAGGGSWSTIGVDSDGAPFDVIWNTGSAADGDYELRATTTDDAGNSFVSAARTVEIDNTAPTGALTAPADGAAVRGTISLSSSSADAGGSGVDSVLFERRPAAGGTWSTVGTDADGAPFGVSFATGSVADGDWELRVVTTDHAGNTVTSPLRLVTVDNSDPTAALDDPGADLRGSVPLTASATDGGGSGVASVAFERFDGSSWQAIATDSDGAPWTATWTTTVVADGLHDLRSVSTDRAGNQKVSPVVSARRVDNSDPTATLSDPGANLRGSVSLAATASDAAGSGVASVAFQRFDGAAWQTIATDSDGAPWTAAWSTSGDADGLYDLRALVTDAAGNSSPSATVSNRRVDNTDPSGSLTAPADGSALRGTVALTTNSADSGSGVTSVLFERRPAGGGAWSAIGTDSDGAPYSVDWATAGAEGEWDLRATTTDAAGNSVVSALRTVTVDNTDPSGSLSAPAEGAALRGTVALTTSSADTGGSGVDTVLFERRPAGGGAWSTIGTDSDGAPYSVDWATGAGAEGEWELRATTTDRAGNTAVSPLRTVEVDNTDPSGSLTSPADGALVSGSITLSSSSADSGSGVDNVLFERRPAGGGSWSAIGADSDGSPFSVSWNSASVADGDWELRATTTDRAGNSFVSSLRTVSVDNDAPSVSLTDPGANLRGSVSLAASASGDTASVLFERRPAGGGPWTALGVDASPPFSLAWDTAALADGLYDLRAVATDGAGNSTPSTPKANRRVDNTAPTGSLTAPADGSALRGSITVSTGSADVGGSGVATVLFERRPSGGGSWSTIGIDSDGAPYSIDWATAAGSEGEWDLRATTTDAAGNSVASALRTVTVDNTDPSGSLTSPADGAAVRGTISLSANSADMGGSAIASVRFERRPAGGSSWTTIAVASTTPWSVSWDSASAADGDWELRAVTTDGAGNSFVSAARTVTIDNTDPGATLADPGVNLRGSVALSTSATDAGGSGVATVSFERFDGTSWQTIGTDTDGAPWTASWPTADVADGLYDLRAVATDRAGNQKISSAISARRVDNTSPSSSITTPDPGATTGGTIAVVAAAADSGSGIDSVLFEQRPAANGPWTAIGTDSDGAPFDESWNSTGSDGPWELRATATDGAGNTRVSAIRVIVLDNTQPTLTLDDPGAALRDSVTLTANASSDAGAVVFERRVAGGGPWATIGTDSSVPYSVAWDTAGTPDGVYDLRAVTTDAAGNTGVSPLVADRRVDNTAPTSGLTAPSAGAAVRATVTLTSDSVDADGSGVASVRFEHRPARGGPWKTIETDADGAPWTGSWNTAADPEGDHELRAVTVDRAGNATTSPARTVEVDNTDPAGTLTSPHEGDEIGGVVALAASASDGGSGVASVEFLVRVAGAGSFATVASDTSSPFDGAWSTAGVPEGPAELKVRVTDRAGNTFLSATMNVTVDNSPPSATLDPLPEYARGSVALVASASADTSRVVFERRAAGAPGWTLVATDASPPYGVDLDTTALADGQHELRAVAFDLSGDSGASPALTTRVDNTAPTGSISSPANGITVGGGPVAIAAAAADGSGSGVVSVAFSFRRAGDSAYTPISTDTSEGGDWTASWSVAGLPSGDYELRALATDAAGNVATLPISTVSVDATPPSVSVDDPGAVLSGIVTVRATAGADAARVAFAYRPGGGAEWTTIAVDSAAPWSAQLDTEALADGGYDLRATAVDGFGNAASDVRTGLRVDNSRLRLISSSPADGATVAAAASIELVADEPIAGIRNARLDGVAAPSALPGGDRVSYATGPLSAGPHVLAGELEDEAGQRTPFRVHFTVWSGSAADLPHVEKNTSALAATTVQAAAQGYSATMPAGAWSAPGGDWIVLRIDPSPAPATTNGFESTREAIEISAHWALSAAPLTQFGQPVDILVGPDAPHALPVAKDGTAWRPLRELAPGGGLAPGSDDGFYRDASGLHVLTRRTATFTVVRDAQAPSAPATLSGTVRGGTLELRWPAATDNSGSLGGYVVQGDGKTIASVGADDLEASISGFTPADRRAFSVVAKDAAGNVGDPTYAIRAVPTLENLTLEAARTALLSRALTVGAVKHEFSTAFSSGRVIRAKLGGVVREGTAVPLVVSKGRKATAGSGRLTLNVRNAEVRHDPVHDILQVEIELSSQAVATAQLRDSSGRTVFTWNGELDAGSTTVEMQAPSGSLEAGRYTVVISAVGTNGTRATSDVSLEVPPADVDDDDEGADDADDGSNPPSSGGDGGATGSGSPAPSSGRSGTPAPTVTPPASPTAPTAPTAPPAPSAPEAAPEQPEAAPVAAAPRADASAREAVSPASDESSQRLFGLLLVLGSFGLAALAALVKSRRMLLGAFRRPR